MCHSMNIVERNVLVLNQSYEPLHICNVKRAIILIFESKASVVLSVKGRVLRTVNNSYPVPSIIRLREYIRINLWLVVLNKSNILKRDNYTCQYCGTQDSKLTIDHIIPKALGGKDTWSNLVTACQECNNKKGHRSINEAGMTLEQRPRRPHRIHTLQKFVESNANEWRPYLFLD